MELPKVTSREEWLEARKELLAKEFIDLKPLGRQEG